MRGKGYLPCMQFFANNFVDTGGGAYLLDKIRKLIFHEIWYSLPKRAIYFNIRNFVFNISSHFFSFIQLLKALTFLILSFSRTSWLSTLLGDAAPNLSLKTLIMNSDENQYAGWKLLCNCRQSPEYQIGLSSKSEGRLNRIANNILKYQTYEIGDQIYWGKTLFKQFISYFDL